MADLRAPWKIKLNVLGNGPYAVLIKLVDYMYTTGTTPRDSTTALGLPHNIIAYLPDIYDSQGQLLSSATEDNRYKYGIFLAKPTYDNRAPVTRVTSASYKESSPRPLDPVQTPFNGYYIIDPAAILPPEEADYTSALCYGNWSPYGPYEYSATVAPTGGGGALSSFIVLEKPDSVLETSLSGTSCKPFTRLRFNSTGAAAAEAADVVRFFTNISDAVSDSDVLNPAVNTALNYTYVWIRCSYFADYVQPDTFKQDLTAEANVQHKNLIVGGGDFARFARTSAEPEYKTPYLPATPPRTDLLPDLDTKASFPAPAYQGTYAIPTSSRAAPVGWFDPDYDDTQPAEGTTHTVALPPEGNFYTSGRVFSPTIDELWVYVKKLVDGRPADNDASYTTGTDVAAGPRAVGDIVTASRTIAADTRVAQEPNLTLTVGGNTKYGDPLTLAGDSSFVNESQSIQYVVNANVKYVADMINSTLSPYYPFTDYASTGTWATRTASRTAPGIHTTASAPHWGPRSNPYSLRELEAYIKNVEYNAEFIFNYLSANKVSSGNTDTSGTLFQLHADYVADVNAAETGNSTRWLVTGNTTTTTTEGTKDGTGALPYGSSRVYAAGATNSAVTYDRLVDIPKEDVYMSAEGKWRYLFDHVRLPILDEKY